MSLHSVYIGLGSNLNGPGEQVQTALKSLDSLPQTRVIKQSQLYASTPQGPQDQPDFVNAVSLIETALEPLVLLNVLQALEQQQGRVKKRHWGERNIDLDILLFDNDVISTERLTVPHEQMHNRDFVLLPLAEISAGLLIPNLGLVDDLIAQLEITYVKPWQAT